MEKEEIKDDAGRPKKAAPVMSLRTPGDLVEAHEWMFNQQKDGKMDAKTADSLNTTLKGAVYLNGKLRMDAAKLWMTAQIKKIELPPGLLFGIVALDEAKPEKSGH